MDDIKDLLKERIELYKKEKNAYNKGNLQIAISKGFDSLYDNPDEEVLKTVLLANSILPLKEKKDLSYGYDGIHSFGDKFPKSIIDYLPVGSTKSGYTKPYFIKSLPYPINPMDLQLQNVFEPIILKDDLRPIMGGIEFLENGATGTDANKLLHVQGIRKGQFEDGIYRTEKKLKDLYKFAQKERVSNVGTFQNFSKKNMIIEGKYPNWKAIIPKDVQYISTINLKDFSEIVELIYQNKLHALSTNVVTFEFPNVKDDEGNTWFFSVNIDFLRNLIKSFLLLDIKDVDVFNSSPTRAIIFSEKDKWDGKDNSTLENQTFGLLMPVISPEIIPTKVIVNGESEYSIIVAQSPAKEYVYGVAKSTKKDEPIQSSKTQQYLEEIEGYQILIEMEDDADKISNFNEAIEGYIILLELEDYDTTELKKKTNTIEQLVEEHDENSENVEAVIDCVDVHEVTIKNYDEKEATKIIEKYLKQYRIRVVQWSKSSCGLAYYNKDKDGYWRIKVPKPTNADRFGVVMHEIYHCIDSFMTKPSYLQEFKCDKFALDILKEMNLDTSVWEKRMKWHVLSRVAMATNRKHKNVDKLVKEYYPEINFESWYGKNVFVGINPPKGVGEKNPKYWDYIQIDIQ